jgi:hypothetical protein
MDDKVEQLMREVDRLLMHVGYSVPPEVAVIEEIQKLIVQIRAERKEGNDQKQT